MTYEEKLEYIINLGWVNTGDWNERSFYSLMYDGELMGQLVEHNGTWYISKGNDMYYMGDLSVEVIKEYTNILKALIKTIKENITPRNKYLISIALVEASRSVARRKVK